MYVKIENNEVIKTQLPKTGTLKNGCTVSGYDLLDEQTLKSEGWLPLEENKPQFDEATQYLEFVDYTILANKVIANYTVKDIELQIVDEPVDDEKVAMAEAIIDFDNRLRVLEERGNQ